MSPPGESAEGAGESVVLGLGSNLGDRLEHLRAGLRGLAGRVSVDAVSDVVESEPVGYLGQPDFLNAIVRGRTGLDPETLLRLLLSLEARSGRRRTMAGGPRTLDMDLIFYGDRVIDTTSLSVPHPRWMERAFVCVPLLQVDPCRVDPVSGRTVRELCEGTPRRGLRHFAAARVLEASP